MKVHHLNCGTMQMPGFPMVAHVLLIETDNGLVLVDTGFGLDDIAHPVDRLPGHRWTRHPGTPGDVATLAAALSTVDDAGADPAGAATRRAHSARYTWEACAGATLAAYRQALK